MISSGTAPSGTRCTFSLSRLGVGAVVGAEDVVGAEELLRMDGEGEAGGPGLVRTGMVGRVGALEGVSHAASPIVRARQTRQSCEENRGSTRERVAYERGSRDLKSMRL